MSAAQHTPGPWEQHDLMVSEAGYRPGQRHDICHCGIGMRTDTQEALANARVISAAPEMLEALEQCERWIAIKMADAGWPRERLANPPEGSHLFNARAAIRKARGEEAP